LHLTNGNFSPKAAVFAFYTFKKTKNTEGVLLSFVFYIFADFLKKIFGNEILDSCMFYPID
jgi:hypothetical protein